MSTGNLIEIVESLRAEVASLKEERDALRRKIFTNTNGEFTLENRTFSIEGFDFILDNNFDFDAGFNVSGDFGGDAKRRDYMQMICNALNSHYALTQQLAAANGRVELLSQAIFYAVDRFPELAGAPDISALSNLNEDRDRNAE
jgi:hypothetical protein